MFNLPARKALAAGVIAVSSLGALAPIADAAPSHCDGHRTEVKVEADGTSTATVEVVHASTGELVEVDVTIDGTSIEIEGDGITGASWCIKTARSSTDGSGLTGTSEVFNKRGVEQDVSYVVIYDVSSGRRISRS